MLAIGMNGRQGERGCVSVGIAAAKQPTEKVCAITSVYHAILHLFLGERGVSGDGLALA